MKKIYNNGILLALMLIFTMSVATALNYTVYSTEFPVSAIWGTTNGATWNMLYNLTPYGISSTNDAGFAGIYLYAESTGGKLNYSTDNGATWNGGTYTNAVNEAYYYKSSQNVLSHVFGVTSNAYAHGNYQALTGVNISNDSSIVGLCANADLSKILLIEQNISGTGMWIASSTDYGATFSNIYENLAAVGGAGATTGTGLASMSCSQNLSDVYWTESNARLYHANFNGSGLINIANVFNYSTSTFMAVFASYNGDKALVTEGADTFLISNYGAASTNITANISIANPGNIEDAVSTPDDAFYLNEYVGGLSTIRRSTDGLNWNATPTGVYLQEMSYAPNPVPRVTACNGNITTDCVDSYTLNHPFNDNFTIAWTPQSDTCYSYVINAIEAGNTASGGACAVGGVINVTAHNLNNLQTGQHVNAVFSANTGGYTELNVTTLLTCTENWVSNNTGSCNGNTSNYTIQYYDASSCGTYNNLPANNGTVVSCCVENWVANNTACNGVNYTIQYYDSAMCNTTNFIPANNGTAIACSNPPVAVNNSEIISTLSTIFVFFIIIALSVIVVTQIVPMDEEFKGKVTLWTATIIVVVIIVFIITYFVSIPH